MAFKIYEFKCKQCEKIQEQLVSNNVGRAEDPCVECKAPPEQLEYVLGNSAHGKHLSWGGWKL